jgi:diadenosine tetraphosphate (Ap4A) HIT family hydrolase
LHVVPERAGNRGVGYLRKPWYIPSAQRYEELAEVLDAQDGIINQNEQALAKLVAREQASDEGHLIITSQEPLANDLNQIDAKTWLALGELLRESIKRVVAKLEVKSLRVGLFLGQIGGLSDNNQLQIHLIPRYAAKGAEAKEVIPIPKEVLEVADKLRKAESELVTETFNQLEAQVEIPVKRCNCQIL